MFYIIIDTLYIHHDMLKDDNNVCGWIHEIIIILELNLLEFISIFQANELNSINLQLIIFSAR